MKRRVTRRTSRDAEGGYAVVMRAIAPASRLPRPGVQNARAALAVAALALLGVMATSFPVPADAATLWRKRGPNNEWVYYDRQVPGTEPYNMDVLRPAATEGGEDAGPRPVQRPRSDSPPPAAGPPRRVEILFPANEAVIQIEDVPHMVARARIEPGLNGGQQLWWSLNGSAMSASATQEALRQLPRGEHTLQARVQDAGGKVLLESKPVSFVVREQTAIAPPVGPKLRPPPPKKG